MPKVVRVGSDSHVGHASPTPNPFHKTSYASGSDSVFANDDKVVREGDTTGCGDPAVGKSPDVYATDKLVHRLGDATGGHGSWVPNAAASGSPTVFANESILNQIAASMGVGTLNLTPAEAQDIYDGRQAELAAGVDPDENEGVEYGDGGISTARHGNTSPTNGITDAQVAPGSGAGNGAIFDIQTSSPGSTPSLTKEYSVSVTGAGTNYTVGQTINIPGSDLGGDIANNATITITSVGTNGEITGATVAGTPTATDATYSNLSEPSSFSPNPSADGTPGLNFLSHTDPRILPALKTVLETLTNAVGYTLDITSAYRSPDYNASVGGSKKSMHMQGKAVDVIMTGKTDSERQQFIQAAIDAGIKGIGVYNSFTHIDIRDNKAAWGANGSRTGLPAYPWAQQVLGANGYATS